MKSKLIALSVAIALSNSLAIGQINPEAFGLYTEALTFSQTRFGGSARIQGIGGAQVSLGGDLSSALSNPAGLGFYNRSEFTFSPALNFLQSDASFNDNGVITESENFNINQLGVVINKTKKDTDDDFKGGSFAITLQRTNSFKQEFVYDGFNDNNSIVDFFLEQADGLPFTNLENVDQIGDSGTDLLSLAYNSFLINPVDGTFDQYDSFITGFPRQQETVDISGSQYQWNISAGGNYKDRFYFGGGIGIATLNYELNRTLRESEFVNDDGTIDDAINEIIVIEETDLDGIGVNATFGVIFRPINTLTVGLSYVSPTWYTINDETANNLITEFNNFQFDEETVLNLIEFDESELRVFSSDYNLRTPSKLNLGASYFFGKNGFVSADVEMVNFGGANLNSDDFSTTADNQTIRNIYKRVVNLRVGAEYRIDVFRLRAGYAYYPDPIEDSTINTDEQNINFGLGYRSKKFYADLAVVNSFGDQAYSPYFLGNNEQPLIEIDNRSTNVLLTVGFSF